MYTLEVALVRIRPQIGEIVNLRNGYQNISSTKTSQMSNQCHAGRTSLKLPQKWRVECASPSATNRFISEVILRLQTCSKMFLPWWLFLKQKNGVKTSFSKKFTFFLEYYKQTNKVNRLFFGYILCLCQMPAHKILTSWCLYFNSEETVSVIASFFSLIFAFPEPTFFVQIGAGEIPDDTMLTCSRGSDRFASLKFRLCSRYLKS